jgi:hypothetical protein
MILLFLDLKGALFHSLLELKITVNSIQSRSIWAYVSPLPVLRPGSVQVENFFYASGELNLMNQSIEINMSSALKGEPGLATGLTTSAG